MLNVDIIPCLNDNYSYVISDKNSDLVGVIDPSDFEVIDNFILKKYNKIDYILNTHHHYDHVGGNIELKLKYKSKIVGSFKDKNRIPGIDITLKDNEIFKFGKNFFKTLLVPGHTSGHIAFYCSKENIVFTGDTLFSLGCGKIFEGTHEEMFRSLNRIKSLPSNTKIFCGHEYTKNNLEFCLNFDKKNNFLKDKQNWVNLKIKNKNPTIPTTIKEELKTNIFLRCDNSSLKSFLKMTEANDKDIFSKLRVLKDSF